jgi:hypothetical protein
MNLTAASLDEVKRRFAAAKARGCNTVNLYLCNMRDGGPVPSTIYASGGMSGAVSPERVQKYRDIDREAARADLAINWWLLADDGAIPYKDAGAIKTAIRDVALHLGDVIKASGGYVVVALESNETLTEALVREYAREIKAAIPGVKVANHMTSGQYSWSKAPEIDAHFHQTEPGASVAAFTAEIKNVVAKVGKPVFACEFSLTGTDETAKQKARIALDAGCAGVHSGVPK